MVHRWLGDALDASEQAMYNFDMAPVYTAYFQTIEDNQDPLSGDLPAVVPKPQWLAHLADRVIVAAVSLGPLRSAFHSESCLSWIGVSQSHPSA